VDLFSDHKLFFDPFNKRCRPISEGTVSGLRLHPAKTRGKGNWKLRYISPETGKRRDIGLGAFPKISIIKARQIGAIVRTQIEKGIDPLNAGGIDKLLIKKKTSDLTFENAARATHSELKIKWKNEKYESQWLSILKKHIFPIIGSMPVQELTTKDFINILRPIWVEQPKTAQKIKQVINRVMEWSWNNGFTTANPVVISNRFISLGQKTIDVNHHFSFLPSNFLPGFIAKNLISCDENIQRLILFLILTSARSNEVRKAKWDDINISSKTWIIPTRELFYNTIHLSLSSLNLLLIQRQFSNEGLIFPSPRGKIYQDYTMPKFLRKVLKSRNTNDSTATIHGFRYTFGDWATEKGYDNDVISYCLGIKNKRKTKYDGINKERISNLMEEWAEFCTICSKSQWQTYKTSFE